MPGWVWIIIVVGIIAVIVIALWSIYNGLVGARLRVKEAWSGIDVQLKRRSSLIPNLVETSTHITVRYETSSGAQCTAAGAIACWVANWTWDASRSAWYFSTGTVYLDPATSWYSALVQNTVAQEVGHALGLHEKYLHSGGCASGPSTVMDWPLCDTTNPTANDTSWVNTFYAQSAPSSPTASNCTAFAGYRSMCVSWYDSEPTNAFTYYDAWKCNDYPTCSSNTYYGGYWHQPGAGYYLASNSAYTQQPPALPTGYYWASIYHDNAAASGLGPGVSTGKVYLP